MAITKVKDGGIATGAATPLTITIPAGGHAAGNVLLVAANGIHGASPIGPLTDSRGNTYTRLDQASGGSAPITNTALFGCKLATTLQAGDTITVPFPGSGTFAASSAEFTGADLNLSAVGATFGSASTATPAVGPITPLDAGALVIAAVGTGAPSTTTYTEDADSVGGDTWHPLTPALRGTGNGDSNLHWAYKIPTTAVAQTYNPAYPSTNFVSGVIEALVPAGTAPHQFITTQFLTGFEHGSVLATGGGLFDIVNAGWSATTSAPRNGSYCAHVVAPLNTEARLSKTVGGTKIVMRFAVKVTSRPSSGVAQIAGTTAGVAVSTQIFVSSTGVLSFQYKNGPREDGPTIDTTSWHLIEVQTDSVGLTGDWRVDGVAQTRSTAVASSTDTTVHLGPYVTGPAYTADFDDWIVGTWTSAETDWYGDGKVLAQLPGADGTHNLSGTTNFSLGDAGTIFGTAGPPTPAYLQVDDPPGTGGWTATRSTTDNLALRGAVNTPYLSIAPTTTAETGAAKAVRAIMSYSTTATQANLAACEVRNGDLAVVELWGLVNGVGKAYNVTANNFKGAIVPAPAAGWTAAEVNAIRFRFGGCLSVDISPVPTVQALMLEVDWPVATGPQAFPRTASDTVSLSDAATRAPITRTQVAADTVTCSDNVTRTSARARTAPDSWVVSDTATRTSTGTRPAADAVTVGDTAAGVYGAAPVGFTRAFDGVDDVIRCIPPPYFGGPWTLLVVCRRYAPSGWEGLFSIGPSGGNPDIVAEYGTGNSNEVVFADRGAWHMETTGFRNWETTAWRITAFTRSATGASVIRFHDYDGATWFHGDQSAGTGDMTAEPANWVSRGGAELRFGNWDPSFNFFEGVIAVEGLWRGVGMTDGQIEALVGGTKADWIAAGVTNLWEFNQPSTTVPVTDAVGSANQFSLVGTTVSGDLPPTWLYRFGAVGPASYTGAAVDAVAVSDAALRAPGVRARPVADSVALSDAALRAPTPRTRPVVDTVIISDAVTRAPAARVRVAVDSVVTSDTAVRAPAARPRTAADVVATSDTALRAPVALPRTAADAWAASDAATGVKVVARPVADAVTISDSAVRAPATRACVAVDAVGISDTAVRATAARVRVAADSTAVSDVATGVVITGAVRPAADSWVVSDTAARAPAARPRTASDSWVVSDAAVGVKIGGLLRTAADAVVLSDAAVRAPAARPRTAPDSWAVSDVATRTSPRARTAVDSWAVSDAAIGVKVGGTLRSATDSVALADTAVRAPATRARLVTDALALADTAVRAPVARTKGAVDGWAIVDVAVGFKVGGVLRTAADTWGLSDVAVRGPGVRQRAIADTVLLTDAAARGTTRVRVTVDTVSTGDVAAGRVTLRAATVDTWAVSDSVMWFRPTGITVINNAWAIYLGSQPVNAVYLGTVKVWPGT